MESFHSSQVSGSRTVFISYSRADQNVAADLEACLQKRGIATWADFSRIPVGERFVEEIAGALDRSAIFLLISSESSARSYWVSREVACAKRLHASGSLDYLVELDLDRVHALERPFDRTFTSMGDAIEYVIQASQHASHEGSLVDVHQVEIEYSHPRPAPRVWLGFSAELAALDRWFFGGGTGLWVSGLGGGGKSSLVQVWITALRMIGYESPLNVSVQQWDFYESPDAATALERIMLWAELSRQTTQLLFLDGMDEVASPVICEVNELGIRYPRLKTLVTSRQSRPNQYSLFFDALTLQSLDLAQTELLASRLGVGKERAGRLFNALKGHPLTISLAANLVSNGCDLEDLFRTLD